jgi:hypothetical protein
MAGLMDFMMNPVGGLGAGQQAGGLGGFQDLAGALGPALMVPQAQRGAVFGIGAARAGEQREKRQTQNMTAQFLLQRGLAKDEAEAMAIAQQPGLMALIMKEKDNIINAGDGRLYNQTTDEWITAPGGSMKPPEVQEFFDENGQPYKAQWNSGSGNWERQGGSKAPAPKSPTEQVVRNRQLYSVVAPEAKTLLGDGVNPGVFDSLGSGWDQAGAGLAGGIKQLTGLDASGVLTSAPYQQAKNSVKSIYSSYIYSVSGASAPEAEVERQASLLMPVPGEPASATQAKKVRLKTMVDAIKSVAESAPGGVMGVDAGTVPPPEDGVIDAGDYFGSN